jgi:hypothetical protein
VNASDSEAEKATPRRCCNALALLRRFEYGEQKNKKRQTTNPRSATGVDFFSKSLIILQFYPIPVVSSNLN